MKLNTITGTVGLEAARIGWQRFAFGLATCDQTAALSAFAMFATRRSAQPLRKSRERAAHGLKIHRGFIAHR
jgi:transketolase C-terminal domain/subunit